MALSITAMNCFQLTFLIVYRIWFIDYKCRSDQRVSPESIMDRSDDKNKNKVDLSRFGLASPEAQSVPEVETIGFATGGYQPANRNELFAGEEVRTALNILSYSYSVLFHEDNLFQNEEPWWKTQFFISEPVLFGMWDGVFTSCLINIFGVIVFLRSGWIVAQAGILNAVLIVLSTGTL